MKMATWLSIVACAASAGFGCAALKSDMRRAEDSFEQARYDDALVWLTDLEEDVPDMDHAMAARFYYLRGMTAYRLGRRNDALHYLAVAREVAGDDSPLRPERTQAMTRSLEELTPRDASFRARTAEEAAGESEEDTAEPDQAAPAP